MFPKVTKCTFHKFGPSGTVERFDGLCVLPLNIINEKIYVFLWFWFIIVSVVSGFQVYSLNYSANSPIYAKVSQQRFCACNENGLTNMIPTIPHKLCVSFESGFPYCGLG